eukprot:Nk52_evm26s1810 gene=Nk52_evmTU26s1810
MSQAGENMLMERVHFNKENVNDNVVGELHLVGKPLQQATGSTSLNSSHSTCSPTFEEDKENVYGNEEKVYTSMAQGKTTKDSTLTTPREVLRKRPVAVFKEKHVSCATAAPPPTPATVEKPQRKLLKRDTTGGLKVTYEEEEENSLIKASYETCRKFIGTGNFGSKISFATLPRHEITKYPPGTSSSLSYNLF